MQRIGSQDTDVSHLISSFLFTCFPPPPSILSMAHFTSQFCVSLNPQLLYIFCEKQKLDREADSFCRKMFMIKAKRGPFFPPTFYVSLFFVTKQCKTLLYKLYALNFVSLYSFQEVSNSPLRLYCDCYCQL